MDASEVGSGIAVTPLSDMVARRAATLAVAGIDPGTAVSQARQELQALFSLRTAPELTMPSFNGVAAYGAGNAEPYKMALLLVAIDTFAHQCSAQDFDAMSAQLTLDFGDGKLDGRAGTDALQYGSMGAISASTLKAVLYTATETAVTALASSASPQDLASWSNANPEQAVSGGLMPLAPGYSCSIGYALVNDSAGRPVCWDGTAAADGTPLIGPYTVCSANGAYVAGASQCPTTGGYSCTAGYHLVTTSSGVTCWDGTRDGNGTALVGTYYVCAANGAKVASESQCPPSSGINMMGSSTTIATYTGSTVNATASSTLIAQYTAPTIQAIQAATIQPISAAELAAMDAATYASLPSYVSSPPLTSAQLDWYNTLNQQIVNFYSY